MHNFLFRLPQTIIRTYGLEKIDNLKYFQAPINTVKQNLDTSIVNSIYALNFDLLQSIQTFRTIEICKFPDTRNQLSHSVLLESNLVRTYSDDLKELSEIYLVPYASTVFNPVYSDLSDIEGFLRCLKDSWSFKQLISPKGVLDYASLILNNTKGKEIPWFWKSIPLSFNAYNSRIKLANYTIGLKSPWVQLVSEATNPIIIQPTLSYKHNTYKEVLEYYYSASKGLQEMIDGNDVTIFLKPHRSDISQLGNHKIDRFRDHKVFFPESFYDFFIPVEILLNSNYNTTLVSEVSSSIFNSSIRQILIRNNLTESLFHQYGLIASRFHTLSGR